jgi:foldase protein PrsA
MLHFHRSLAVLTAAALCVFLAACAGGGGNVMSVNGQNISHADLDRKLEAGPAARQTLNQMVQQALIDQYGKDAHVDVTVTDVDKKEAEVKAKYPPGQFEQILIQQGLTETDVQNILRQQIILERAVAPQIHVTDADIKAYFAQHHAQYDTPERVRARHILVADPKTADTIEAKLKNGGNFADLAKQYSTDPSSKEKGGELGFFGRGTMVPAFQNAAFSMKPGQISAPVHSPFGYHIIQVEEVQAAKPATLASAHDQIVQQLTQQQQSQQIPVFLQQLRAKANIVVYDNRYKDLFPPPPPAPASAAPAPASAAPAPASPAAPSPAASK